MCAENASFLEEHACSDSSLWCTRIGNVNIAEMHNLGVQSFFLVTKVMIYYAIYASHSA